jgi:hypothetical protein
MHLPRDMVATASRECIGRCRRQSIFVAPLRVEARNAAVGIDCASLPRQQRKRQRDWHSKIPLTTKSYQ